MKHSTFLLMAGIFMLSAAPAFSQLLPAVTVVPANYKYLKTVGGKEVAIPVQRLQRTAAAYDIKESEYYEEDYDTYFISFYLPEGQILAAYDSTGKLIRTAEKYKNVKLPSVVTKSVTTRFPNWAITKDTYLVTYFEETGQSTKKYKLLLENGSKRIRIETNEQGEIL